MQALVLDFDGVISDSLLEVFQVAGRTYRELRPDSALLDRNRDDLFRGFRDLLPLGNRAEDFGIALAALEQGAELPDQAAYDRFRATLEPAWLDLYHQRFYAARQELAAEDPAAWRALMLPYAPLLELLRRRAGRARYAIATAKDRRSVAAMLIEYGIADLFPGELVLDKETGRNKRTHLRRLRELLDLPFPEMTFVDDKVNHLDSVAPLGVRCALAAWGYNGPRERELAGERGYVVCTLADAEQLLFDRPYAFREGGRLP